MNNVVNSLKEVLKISTVISYTETGFIGEFIADEDKKIHSIIKYTENCTNSNNYISIDFDDDDLYAPMYKDFKIGNSYSFVLSVNIISVRSNFFSTLDYLLNYVLSSFEKIDWNSKIIIPFENDLASDVSMYRQYFVYLNEIMVLYAKYAYLDGHRQVVLFTNKPLVISPNSGESFKETYKKIFDNINIEVLGKSIYELKEFLNEEPIDKHKTEKQSIFIMETANILENYEKSERFYELVKSIEKISSCTLGSFQAYLNNFSYQKLELELKKDLDYFVKSVNDSLGTLQTQALGLPVAAALIQLNKVNLNISYLALMIFSGFVMFNTFQQNEQLAYIRVSIERFFNKGDVSSIVTKDKLLSRMQHILDSRFNFISVYVRAVLSIATLIFVYGFESFLSVTVLNYKLPILFVTCLCLIVFYIYLIRDEYKRLVRKFKIRTK